MSERTAKKRARPARPASPEETSQAAVPPAEAPLSEVLSALPGALVLLLDTAGRVSFASPELERLLGRSAPRGEEVREACPELRWLAPHLRADSAGARKATTFEHTWAEHDTAYEVRVQPLASGTLVHLRDLTAERRALEPQQQAERLRLCMEAAHIVTWDWDLRTGIVRWSANLTEVTGVPMGKRLEGSFEDFLKQVLAEDRPLVEKSVAQALKVRDALELEFRVTRPAGEVRWMRIRGRVQSERRKAVMLLGVVMDITHEKLATEEARLHAEFQEHLVGIVSHDIRSPLGAIINWSRVLADGGSGEDLHRTSRRITAAAVRIERLTRLLLDFTRARLGGGISIEPRKTDLHELFDKVAHEFRVAFPGRKVHCEREGDARGNWDPDRLGQVLSNLVENALKYSPEDTSVYLRTRGDKEHVVLEVHNKGKPIDPETLQHLFEPFRRGPQTARTLKVSYGLGLYIVREIVRAHGGTIEVHSTEKDGTTLRVRLPRQSPRTLPGALVS
ncbi:ATP-binding protein [Myxococcaceae bacterium GXIMD 01537]